MIPYGYPPAGGLLRRGRSPQLLAGRRAAGRHATGGEPPYPLAREAPRAAAVGSFRAPCRADRGGTAALPERAAAARSRADAARGGRRRRGGRACGAAGDRVLDRAGRHGAAAVALPVPGG